MSDRHVLGALDAPVWAEGRSQGHGLGASWTGLSRAAVLSARLCASGHTGSGAAGSARPAVGTCRTPSSGARA